jgi:hypothetical protein
MMNRRKTGNTGQDDSDRKHLTGREVERLIEATKGSRNEARDRCRWTAKQTKLLCSWKPTNQNPKEKK